MLSFEKLNDLGAVALHVYLMYQNASEWLTANYLIAQKVLPIASHIYFYQKSTILVCVTSTTDSRGHSYALSICPNELCKRSYIPRSLFCFL